MKKYLLFLIILLSLLGYMLNRSFNRVEVFRVGVECDYPPNNWEESRPTDSNVPLANKKGFYAEGYDIQLAKLVAEHMGAELEVKKIAWQDLIPALQRKEIDAIFSGMLNTEERRKVIAFSDVYGVEEIEYTLVVNKDSEYEKARKLTDFTGAVLIAQKGTNLDAAIDQIPTAIHLTPVATVSEMLEKLVNHEVDGSVMNFDTARAYASQYPNLRIIRFPKGHGFVFDFTGICAGVRKNDTKLLSEINHVLGDLSRRDRLHIMDRTISRQWRNINL